MRRQRRAAGNGAPIMDQHDRKLYFISLRKSTGAISIDQHRRDIAQWRVDRIRASCSPESSSRYSKNA